MLSGPVLKPGHLRAATAAAVGAGWTVFQIYTGFFGELSAIPQRAIHLGFALTLLFLVRPSGKEWENKSYRWLGPVIDAVLIAAGIVATVYLAYDHVGIAERLGRMLPREFWFGLVIILVLLEGTRRAVGWPLPLIAVGFLLYGFYGNLIPGDLGHRAYSLERVIGQVYLMTEGIFGVALGVSAGFLFLFVAFATFLKESGGGVLFTDFATGLAGRARGGPAKIAVVGSGFFGMISGSAVANVAGVGSFTIPLMKRIGYTPQFAGAVEAVASTGGVIMPPVMGATAFIMAELLGISYVAVAKAAFVPAALYYFSLFCMVHLEAVKRDLKGLKREEIPNLRKTFLSWGHLAIPICALVYMLVKMPDSPSSAASWSVLLIVIVASLRSGTRMGWRKVYKAMAETGRAALDVALTCACIGIIVGVVMLTGLGGKLAGLILFLSGGNLTIILILTAIASLILGMGLPITPAYLILVLIVGPAINDLGLLPIATHMFMLYFGAISFITPPVAIAAYAGAALAGSNPFRTGFTATRLGMAGFIVPFAFAANPALLLVGSPGEVSLALITAVLGIMALAAGSQGFISRPLGVVERILMVTGAVLLIIPGLKTDLTGIFLIALVLANHYLRPSGKENRFSSGAAGGERDERGKFLTGGVLDENLAPALKK